MSTQALTTIFQCRKMFCLTFRCLGKNKRLFDLTSCLGKILLVVPTKCLNIEQNKTIFEPKYFTQMCLVVCGLSYRQATIHLEVRTKYFFMGHSRSPFLYFRHFLTVYLTKLIVKKMLMGSGCGAVGRAVASDTRGPRFESSHRQNLYVLSSVLKRRK